MRFIWSTLASTTLFFAVVTGNARFCTQEEKQLVNKQREQNVDPAKSCYNAARSDITTMDTSRLCALPECATWLAYVAANSPDCYYDSINYATLYADKNGDCTGTGSSGTSGTSASASSTASTSASSTGSGSAVNESFTAEASSSGSNSSSMGMSEERSLNSTASMDSSLGGSDVGEMVASASGSAASASSEVEVTETPTPTPTEDLSIEATSAPSADSSNSTTPEPTTSASNPLRSVSTFVTALSFAVALATELAF